MKKYSTGFKFAVLVLPIILFCLVFIPQVVNAEGNDPVVTVTKNGCSVSGSVFDDDEPLYPGCPEITNTLRIENTRGGSIHIKNIGMSAELSRQDKPIPPDSKDAKDFYKYINIKVEYKSFLKRVFQGTIYNGSLEDFMDGVDCSIAVSNNGSIALRYALSMNKEAEDNIEDITSDIDFTITIAEFEKNRQ